MTKMSVGVFAAAICAAVSVQAETWQVFSHDAKPTKDGAEQGDAEMAPAAQLAYAVANAAGGSDINLQKGLYDFSGMEPVGKSDTSYAYIYIPQGRRLHFYGEGEKHWSEKTREEETILSGGNTYPLVYGVNGSSRCSKFYGISFENSTNTYSDAGGAIAMTANECYADTPPSLVSNCVFRNCRSDRASGKGGGTSYISAFDCFYTNCTAAGKGGGAYGGDRLISGAALHSTNTFQNCTFIGCSGSTGGGLFCESGANCKSVSGCTFISCAATGSGNHGGGAYFGSYVEGLSDCVFENCTTKGGGGGLWLAGGTDYLRGCRFVGNTSSSASGGGGFRSEGSMPLELTNCAFTNNTSTSGYGGNASAKHFGAVTDCVFKGGRAAKGAGVNAGVTSAASRELANGDFVRCVFEDNKNNDRVNDGSHVNNALSLTDCQFTGWGDVWARTVDRCSFVKCEYYPNDGSYNDGLIRLTDGVTTPEDIGRVRNCLFARCLASVLIENESYYNAEIENCTFADNILTNAVHHDGYVLYAWRATPPGESGTHPATNLVSNCIFWNNLSYKYSNQTCERADPKLYRTTNVSVKGGGTGSANIVQNCIYGVKGDSENPQRATNFNQVDSPKFVKDNATLKANHPEYPDYMICRDSPAVDTGVELDWHETGKDLLGNDRVVGAAVDQGAYECNLTQVAYADGKEYDSLDEALEDVGATKRIGLYDDVRLDNWDQITPERYFVDTNGHTVTAPDGADVQVVNGTLSVGVSAIYEPAGAFNVMPGDLVGLTNALVNATKTDVIVLSPGTYDLSVLTEQRVPEDTAQSLVLGTAYSADGNGYSSLVWRNERQIKGACKVHWSEKTAAQETLIRNNGNMRIFYGYTGGGRASKFANLSFEGGDAQGLNGGAILFAGAEYGGYVTNCVFRNCKGNAGGATYDVTAYDCFYENNLSTKCGGAAFGCETKNGSNVKTNDFVDCIFVGNKTTGADGGGAIYCEKQNLIVGCAFTNNEATAGAGGAVRVAAVGASAVVSNCVFSGNSANAAEMTGGGASGCGDVYDSQFYDNSSYSSGGGVYNSSYSVYNCVFSNNVSKSWGGGWRGDGRCIGCTFIGNRQAARGGALYCNGPVAAITNCTFIGNNCEDATSKSGTTYGGAVYASNRLDMENCLFDGNEARLGAKGCVGTGGSVWCSTVGEIANCTFKNGMASRETGGLCINTLSGTIRDCTFDSNTNAPSGSYPGSHLRGAQSVVGCTFTGYGDVCAKSYDRCTFTECVFPYLNGNVSAFLTFRYEYGEGTVRNCLFASNSVNHIMASEGVVTRFENCTFSDNVIPHKGCLFWAFRYGGGSSDKSGIPSTNLIANCIFANGTKIDSNGAAQPGDISFYSTGTGVPSGSVLHSVSNSIYGVRGKDYNGDTYNPKIAVNFLGGKDPKFVRDDATLAGKYPNYMPKRNSAAHGLGVWDEWMAGAKDLAGADMPASGAVDAGCYQCTLRAPGMMLIFK